MGDPIEVVWTKTRWACQRDEMAWREAWFQVKALALLGRKTLKVLSNPTSPQSDLDDLMREAEYLCHGVRAEAAILVNVEPWLEPPLTPPEEQG